VDQSPEGGREVSASTTLKAVLIGEDRSLSKTMKGASKDVKGVGDDMDRTSKKSQGLGVTWGKVGGAVAAGAAVAGVAVVGFGIASVKAASDLQGTLSKSSVIFGKNAAEVEKWGETAYLSMGLSKNAAIGAAASFGDMFLQLGFAKDTAMDMSTSVVQLSADLGSFNNLPTAEVADMISSALRGEYDSLQRLIPNINAARVESEALATTGKKNAKELTAQEKAAATLAIVYKDGAKASGDFAKTSGEAANQQKILQAAFEDVKAEVGTALLPILTDLGQWLIDEGIPAVKDMTKWWNDHKEEIQSAATTIGRVLGILGRAVAVTTKMQMAGWRAVGAVIQWIRAVFTTVVSAIMTGLSTLMRTWATMLRALSKVPGFGWAAAAADKMDGAARKADSLKAAINRVPNSKSTSFGASTGTAIGSVRALEASIGRVRGKSVTVSVHYVARRTGRFDPAPTGYSPGRAVGGAVVKGRSYLVGENGPEIWSGDSGTITPARQTAKLLAGGSGGAGGSSGGADVYVTSVLQLDGREVHRSLKRVKSQTGPLGLG
jgi:hypothetical protein